MTPPPVGVWSPVSSHSLMYQHLRLDSTPVLPLSEERYLLTPPSLFGVRFYDHNKTFSTFIFSSVPTPTPLISYPTLTAGASGTLTCDYTLSPPLDVTASATWTVNGSAVTGDERISTDRLSLTLSPLTTSDSGTYTCTLTIISNTPYVTAQGPHQRSLQEFITVKSRSMIVLFFFLSSLSPSPVPPPAVSVSLNRSGTLFAGTDLTLTCTVTVDSSVNNDEAVSTHWSGLDHIVPPERYSVTPAMGGSDGSYTGTLTISPLAEGDDGTLSCTGNVTGGTQSQSTSSTSITVAGSTPY